MKAVFLLLAAAAIASAASSVASDESGSDDYGHTTTMMPCPRRCPTKQMPVCAMDKAGRLYLFNNECEMRQCRCRMYLRQVDIDRCPDDAPGCPLRQLPQQPRVVGGSDESSDESQATASDSADDSLQEAHRNNALRGREPVFV